MALLGRRQLGQFGEFTPPYPDPYALIPFGPSATGATEDGYDLPSIAASRPAPIAQSRPARGFATTPFGPTRDDKVSLAASLGSDNLGLSVAPGGPLVRHEVASFDRPLFDGAFSGPRSESRRERRLIGKWIMGADPGSPPPRLSLNPYRTDRGATVATPLVKMEPSNGHQAPLGGYQTKVPKEAIEALNSAYARGGSEADLFNIAAKYRVRIDSKTVRELINSRDRLRRPGKFVPEPDRSPRPAPIRPGESIDDYIDDGQGGHFEWTGPYTASHPFGRDTAEQLQLIFKPFFGDEEAERLSSAALWFPPLGAMQGLDEAWNAAANGRPAAAAGNSALAILSAFPGTRLAKYALHTVNAAKLKRLAEGLGEGFDAVQTVRGAVEEGLDKGGNVWLRSGSANRRIVGVNDAGRLIDDRGRTWGLPTGRQELEIRVPLPRRARSSGRRRYTAPERPVPGSPEWMQEEQTRFRENAAYSRVPTAHGRAAESGKPVRLEDTDPSRISIGQGDQAGMVLVDGMLWKTPTMPQPSIVFSRDIPEDELALNGSTQRYRLLADLDRRIQGDAETAAFYHAIDPRIADAVSTSGKGRRVPEDWEIQHDFLDPRQELIPENQHKDPERRHWLHPGDQGGYSRNSRPRGAPRR